MHIKQNLLLLLSVVIWFTFNAVVLFNINIITGFPDKLFWNIPHKLDWALFGIAIVIYVAVGLYLFYLKEKKFDSKVKIYKSFSASWFRYKVLKNRYYNLNWVIFWHSIFLAAVIFTVALPFTSLVLTTLSNGKIDDKIQPLNFIHSEGIIISFIVFSITLYTFTNTLVIKDKEREIETLEELFYVLRSKFRESGWEKFNNIFFYVFDFTIATGHYSDPKGFSRYANDLRIFLEKYPVKFKGLTYSRKKIIRYYKSMIKKSKEFKDNCSNNGWTSRVIVSKLNDSVNEQILNSNDVFITYLNHIYGNNRKIKNHIHYYPFRKTNTITPIPNDLLGSFFKREMYSGTVNILSDPQNDNFRLNGLPQANISWICNTDEIGMTRFIVTNLFVVTFIAYKKNGEKNAPAGYISEDINLIERYKKAFEHYSDEKISTPTN